MQLYNLWLGNNTLTGRLPETWCPNVSLPLDWFAMLVHVVAVFVLSGLGSIKR